MSGGYEQSWAWLRGGLVAEAGAGAPHAAGDGAPDERIVQAIWHEQMLDAARLETVGGERVVVHDPGHWNREAGPDFVSAEIEIGGRRRRGDVEIHVVPQGWKRHGHERDFAYNAVILHAYLEGSDGQVRDLLQNGEHAERVELGRFLAPDRETVLRALSRDDYFEAPSERLGRCHEGLMRLPQPEVRNFFVEAGRARMETRIARFAAQRRADSADQILYQAILTALGHKAGKTLYFLLARRVPVGELRTLLRDVADADLRLAVESILLHVAHLAVPDEPKRSSKKGGEAPALPFDGGAGAPDECARTLADGETQEYLNALHRHWARFAGYYEDRTIPPTRRWFAGVRPANFPGRRLSAMACVLVGLRFREGLLQRFAGQAAAARATNPETVSAFAKCLDGLQEALRPGPAGYWAQRFTLGGRRQTRAQSLLGADRAASIYFNAVLPNLILDARERGDRGMEAFLFRLHDNYPSLPPTAITRFMRHRLFGAGEGARLLNFKLEKSNQALYHVFQTCCHNNALSCRDCAFYRDGGG